MKRAVFTLHLFGVRACDSGVRCARHSLLLHLLLARPVCDDGRPCRTPAARARHHVLGSRHRRLVGHLHAHLHVQKVLSTASEWSEIRESIEHWAVCAVRNTPVLFLGWKSPRTVTLFAAASAFGIFLMIQAVCC